MGRRKNGLIRQVKRLNLYEIFYDRTRKRLPLNTGYCLIEVTAWAGLTVFKTISSTVLISEVLRFSLHKYFLINVEVELAGFI